MGLWECPGCHLSPYSCVMQLISTKYPGPLKISTTCTASLTGRQRINQHSFLPPVIPSSVYVLWEQALIQKTLSKLKSSIICSFCHVLSCVQMASSHAEELDLSHSKHSASRRIRPHCQCHWGEHVAATHTHWAKPTLIYICTYLCSADIPSHMLYIHFHIEMNGAYTKTHRHTLHTLI